MLKSCVNRMKNKLQAIEFMADYRADMAEK